MRVPLHPVLFGAAIGALALGCREKAAPMGAIVFQISAEHPTAGDTAGAPFVAADSLVAQGPDTLFLRRVRLVLAELAIAPAAANECEEEEGEELPPCVEFDEKPVVVELPLDRALVRRAAKPAPVTDYNLFQAVVLRPDPTADSSLLVSHPELAGVTVRAEGVFSHAGARRDFVYTTGWSEREEIELHPPLAVSVGDTLHVTLRVDVASWFRRADGRALVDPVTAAPGGPNETLVRDNIRTSITVFRDGNADGLDDAAGVQRAVAR
jgi:hypothetical protein